MPVDRVTLLSTMQILINSGADLNAQTDLLGYTPIIFATIFQKFDAIKLLLNVGADPQIQSHDWSKRLTVTTLTL